MEHETFRHLELEAFVSNEKIVEATKFVEQVLKQCDRLSSAELAEPLKEELKQSNLLGDFEKLENVYTHHYPICIRKVLKDDTMISMASGDAAMWVRAIEVGNGIDPVLRNTRATPSTPKATAIRLRRQNRIIRTKGMD